MNEMNIRQFKLSNGDEVVCEVLRFPEDEEDATLSVRSVYKINMITSMDNDKNRYYQFRPWMVYQDNKDLFQELNMNHIMAEAMPTQELLAHYFKVAVEEEHESPIEDILRKLREAMQEHVEGPDSDSNLITFPGSRRLH
jgi:transcription termination factor Rho